MEWAVEFADRAWDWRWVWGPTLYAAAGLAIFGREARALARTALREAAYPVAFLDTLAFLIILIALFPLIWIVRMLVARFGVDADGR